MISHLVPDLSSGVGRKLSALARARFQVFVHYCKGSGCRRFTVAHRFLRKDGIFLDHSWLCSAGCFEGAVMAALTSTRRAQQHTMPRLPRMPFRLILLQAGVVSEANLQVALAHAEQTGIPLSRVLLELTLVTEAELAAAFAAENGCAFYTLPPAPLAPELQLPNALAERSLAATVHGSPDRIVIGFVHRMDRALLAMVEQITGRKVEGCFITSIHRSMQLALDAQHAVRSENHGPSSTRTITFHEAVRYIKEHALRSGAEKVSVGRSSEMVWIRFYKVDHTINDTLLPLVEAPIENAIPALEHLYMQARKS